MSRKREASERARQVARSRLPNVLRYLELTSLGVSESSAASQIGLPYSSIHRHATAFKARGMAGLTPAYHRCGRRSLIEGVGITPQIIAKVETLAGRLGNASAAWRQFAKDLACPWNLRLLIQKSKHLPPSLINAVKVKPVDANAWRGPSGNVYVNLPGTTVVVRPFEDEADPFVLRNSTRNSGGGN